MPRGRIRKEAIAHRMQHTKRRTVVGIKVRKIMQLGSCQAFDVTEGSVEVDPSTVRNHWKILAGERNNLIYIHF